MSLNKYSIAAASGIVVALALSSCGRDPHPPGVDVRNIAYEKSPEDLLAKAARRGDHDEIRRLTSDGARPSAIVARRLDEGGYTYTTPLQQAATSGEGATAETVRLLITLGADPAITAPDSNLILDAAGGLGCQCHPGKDADRVRALIDSGAPLERAGTRTARTLSRLAREGRSDLLMLFLDKGVSPTGFFDAAAVEREVKAEAALTQKAYDEIGSRIGLDSELLESLKRQSATWSPATRTRPLPHEIPLHEAAAGGDAECVRLLLAAGASANDEDWQGQTALYYARSPEVVRALIAAGATFAPTSAYVYDPIRALLDDLGADPAESERIRATVDVIVQSGATLTLPLESGRDRLYDAAFSENFEAVDYLLKAGHPIQPDRTGRTPLHAICWQSSYRADAGENAQQANKKIEAILQRLISAGADVNARDNDGNTPIHEAVAGDGLNSVAVRALVRAGADINAQNAEGQTPLTLAYSTGFEYEDFVPLLIELGANPLIRDNQGHTAIDLARSMIRGENPPWRVERLKSLPPGDPAHSTGWKSPAEPGDIEYQMLELMLKAAERLSPTK